MTVPAAPAAPADSDTPPSAGPRGAGRQLASLGFDVGAPVAVYYLLHALGVGNLVALGVGAVVPAVGVAWTLMTKRRADGVAVLVVATIVAPIGMSLITRQPRFLLAKDGLITGLWGVWFLVSVRASRPAALVFARPLPAS